MDKYISKTIKEIKPSGIRRFFDIASTIPGCISLGVGEPDFVTPEHIRNIGIESLKEGKTFYTSNQGLLELRQEIAKWNKARYNLETRAEDIIITIGGSEALDIALRAIINPGDEVIVLDPSYVSYTPGVLLAGGAPRVIELKAKNKFRLTYEELKGAINKKTKAIILNYPNNPTGAIMEESDYRKIVDLIIDNDLLVISDEIYAELTYGKKHFSIGSLPGMKDRTIIISGFSKAFSMTGWRLGYIFGPEALIKQMLKIHQYVIMCSPTLAQYAGLEALKVGDKDIAYMRDEYDKRRKFLLGEFTRLGMDCFEPEGAFYCFPSIKRFGLSSDEFAERLLRQEKLVVVPGTAFGDCGEGFLRISYASNIDTLKEAINRLERFIKSLENK